MKLRFLIYLVISISFTGCLSFGAIFGTWFGAYGRVSKGILFDGVTIENSKHLKYYHKKSRHTGSETLINMVLSSADKIYQKFGQKLIVGDISAPLGGKISGHRSHRSGLDVDMAFFWTDMVRRNIKADLSTNFDRFGVAVKQGRHLIIFDYQKNWALVEMLITDSRWNVGNCAGQNWLSS